MTFNEARKILGLGPNEDPRPMLGEFQKARERIAEMVRSAPNEMLARRYQDGLVEFDRALAATHEYLQALGLEAKPEETMSPHPAPSAVAETTAMAPPDAALAECEPAAEAQAEPARKSSLPWALPMVLMITVAVGGWWFYQSHLANDPTRRAERIAELEKSGASHIEARRWQEAANAFAEIDRLSPGSDIVLRGRRSIEAGMSDEQNQFTGYWTGEAISQLEAGNAAAAETAIRKVIDSFPDDPGANALLERIRAARSGESRQNTLERVRSLIAAKDWIAARTALKPLLDAHDQDATSLDAEIRAGLAQQAADHQRASELLAQAAARDEGKFDQQALDWLQEASALDPANTDVTTLLAKFSGYTRTIDVPGDYDTLEQALIAARDNDIISLGAGTWTGPFYLNSSSMLRGGKAEETIIECPPDAGSPLTINSEAKGARVSGVTFRHSTFATGEKRYAAVTLDGAETTFSHCVFKDAAGHGLAAIRGGKATVSHCTFTGNGWNGACASGEGSMLKASDCQSNGNFQNGFECWNSASAEFTNNRCSGNIRNGIHLDTTSATVSGNTLRDNREFGLVATRVDSGDISKNSATANLLGGFVLKASCHATFTANSANDNHGPGITLEKGVSLSPDSGNTATSNTPQDILENADLAPVRHE